MADTLRTLGEEGVLDRIFTRLTDPPAHLMVGPGDDAAVSALPGPTVTTTDMLVEDRDFRRTWYEPYKLGIKAAAQNLADLFAMGATPHGLLVSLAFPEDTPVTQVERLTEGLSDEAHRCGAAVIGGDLSGSDAIVVAVTAIGYLTTAPVLRSGATPGDGVYLAGTVGYAAAGLDLLEAGLASNPAMAPFIETQLRPRPDYATAARLPGWASAAIDVSDGLSGDAGKVAAASGVDIVLDPGAVAALAGELEVAGEVFAQGGLTYRWALHGGEDHGFVVTGADSGAPVGLRRIGECVPGPGRLLLGGKPVTRESFTHFSGQPAEAQ